MKFQVQTESAADVLVQGHGSIVLLWPQNDSAAEWIEENLEPGQKWGNGTVVEPRFVSAIIEGLEQAGYTVG